MDEKSLNAFWAKVNKDGPTPAHVPELGPCWIWTASRHKFGYGYFRVNGSTLYAHRIGWELANGPMPEGMCALHKCDNPRCVRPQHLRLGTKADNSRDMIQKSRGWCPRLKGEQCHQAKLTTETAQLGREMYASGISQAAIAKELGVTVQAIHQLVKRKTWRHIE